MNVIKKVFAAVTLWGVGASVAFAQSQTSGVTTPIKTSTDLQNFLCDIIAWFIWIIIIITVIMVLVAAFDYVTAGDDAEKVSRGRKRLTYAAVGLAIALLAAGFPSIVETLFRNTVNTSVGCLAGTSSNNSNSNSGGGS